MWCFMCVRFSATLERLRQILPDAVNLQHAAMRGRILLRDHSCRIPTDSISFPHEGLLIDSQARQLMHTDRNNSCLWLFQEMAVACLMLSQWACIATNPTLLNFVRWQPLPWYSMAMSKLSRIPTLPTSVMSMRRWRTAWLAFTHQHSLWQLWQQSCSILSCQCIQLSMDCAIVLSVSWRAPCLRYDSSFLIHQYTSCGHALPSMTPTNCGRLITLCHCFGVHRTSEDDHNRVDNAATACDISSCHVKHVAASAESDFDDSVAEPVEPEATSTLSTQPYLLMISNVV